MSCVKRLFACIFLTIFVGWTKMVAAQPDPSLFGYSHLQSLSLEEGLSQVNVHCLLKDQEGFMWVGTDDGLNRFDGYDFEVFRGDSQDSTSLGDSKVFCLFEDSQGQLWVGTNQGGLHRYNSKTKTFRRVVNNPQDPNSLSSNSILGIDEDEDGTLWVATIFGLNAVDPQTQRVTRYLHTEAEGNSIADNYVYDVLVDHLNNKWVATREGLSVIEKDGKIRNYYASTLPGSLCDNEINTLFEDDQHQIWIGTSSGMSLYLPEKDQFKNYLTTPQEQLLFGAGLVRKIRQGPAGNLWIGTDGGGLLVLEKHSESFRKIHIEADPSFSSSVIYDILFEEEQRIWLGTYGDGLKILSKNRKLFGHYKYFDNSMKESGLNTIRCIAEDIFQKLWIGTDGSGLYRYDPQLEVFTHYSHHSNNSNSISNDVIKCVDSDTKGNVYVGHYRGGLSCISPTTGKVKRYRHDETDLSSLSHDIVWSVVVGSDEKVWVGTLGGGLCEFDPQTEVFRKFVIDLADDYSISSNNISKVYEDSHGRIWVGTVDNGLNRLYRSTGRFKRYREEITQTSGMNFNEIIDIYEGAEGNLYVGTNGGGLFTYDETADTFVSIGRELGVASSILSILDDESGNLWMGTFHGICKYSPALQRAVFYREFDGVLSEEFKSGAKAKSSLGKFYFGGSNGMTFFDPQTILENGNKEVPILTDFLLFHEKVPISSASSGILQQDIHYQKSISLHHDQNHITLTFTTLEFDLPKKNQYAYMLEGFDKDWNYVGTKRSATYTNLSPGNYLFKVKATNHDGIWSDDYVSLQIIITPPFWRSTWFLLLASVFVIGVVYLSITYRFKKLHLANMILEDKVSIRTAQLRKLVVEIQEKQTEVESSNRELTAALKDLYTQKNKVEAVNKELKRTDEELRSVNEHLDRIVQVRTADLVKANRELDRFVYSASHDLSAPLKSILGLIQLTKLEDSSRSLMKNLDHMEKSVLNLESVIKTLTQFSRNLGTGVSKENILVNDIVDQVLDDLNFMLDDEQVIINKKFKTRDSIMTDRLRLKILLTNLLSNAVKYRDPAKSKTIIDISFSSNHHNFILKVADNGLGIEPEFQHKVFEMFFRANSQREGSGLGLYIVHEIASKLSGTIELTSQVKIGTVFTVSIPR